jgi:hypothetical protein
LAMILLIMNQFLLFLFIHFAAAISIDFIVWTGDDLFSVLEGIFRRLMNVFTFGNVSSLLSFLRGASFPPASTCPPDFHFDSFPLFLPFNPFQPSAPPANDVFSANKVFLEPTCVICMDSRVSEIKLTRLHQLLLHFFYRLGWFSYLVVICAAVSTVGMPWAVARCVGHASFEDFEFTFDPDRQGLCYWSIVPMNIWIFWNGSIRTTNKMGTAAAPYPYLCITSILAKFRRPKIHFITS